MCATKRSGALSSTLIAPSARTLRSPSALNFPSSFSLCLHCGSLFSLCVRTIVSRPTSIHGPLLGLVAVGAYESGLWRPADLTHSRSHRGPCATRAMCVGYVVHEHRPTWKLKRVCHSPPIGYGCPQVWVEKKRGFWVDNGFNLRPHKEWSFNQ